MDKEKDMCPYCGKEKGYCRDGCIIKQQDKIKDKKKKVEENNEL